MRYLLLVFVLLVAGCEQQPTTRIGLYAFNMLYACEGPNYRVFRVTPAQIEQTGQAEVLSADNADVAHEMSTAFNRQAVGENMIGLDMELEFPDSTAESAFHEAEGMSPICHIYYLEGRYQGRQRFLVEDYRLMEKMSGCMDDPAISDE